MKSSRASPLMSSSTRVSGDSRGAINIPNFGSYTNRRCKMVSEMNPHNKNFHFKVLYCNTVVSSLTKRVKYIFYSDADCNLWDYWCTSHPEVDLYVAVEWVVVDVQRQSELSVFLDVRCLKQSQTVRVQLPPDWNDRERVAKSTSINVLREQGVL